MAHGVRQRRPLKHRLAGTVLNIAAAGGAVCIVLAGLALALDVSLLLFKTGSMAPTIPAGSVAVAREVPASEIEVGDVVSVERPGALPITHRVTGIEEADAGARTITMQGDANESPDAAPYTITSARVVLGSVPGGAHVLVWFSQPGVLAMLTVAASALVTWAFWPARTERPAEAKGGGTRWAGAAAARPGSRTYGLLALLLLPPVASLQAAPTHASWGDEEPTTATLSATTVHAPVVSDCTARGAVLNVDPELVVSWDWPQGDYELGNAEFAVSETGLFEGSLSTSHDGGIYTTTYDGTPALLGKRVVVEISTQDRGWTSAAPARVEAWFGLVGLGDGCSVLNPQ